MTKYLTKIEEYNLYQDYINNNNTKARDTIILNQLDHVKSIAYQFKDKGDFEDLVQEGMTYVTYAFNKWDPEKGATFTTFNRRAIKYHLMKYIDDNKAVKIPSVHKSAVKKINKAKEALDRIKEPKTTDNISTMTGLDIITINAVLRAITPTASLNKISDNHDEGVNQLEANKEYEPEYKLFNNPIIDNLDLSILTDKQREAFELYIKGAAVDDVYPAIGITYMTYMDYVRQSIRKLNKHYKKLKDINQAGSMWYQGKSYFEIAKKLKVSHDEARNYVSIYYKEKTANEA